MRIKLHLVSAIVLMLLMIPCLGYADPCDELENNDIWISNLEHLKAEIESQTYDAAMESARMLYGICPDSPVLNYYLGVVMKKTGEDTKSTMYFQKASEATSRFVVQPEMSRLIWYARYEAEHPDSTESSVGLLKQQNALLTQQNENLRMDAAAKNGALDSYKSMTTSFSVLEQDVLKKKYRTVMWTGISIGIVGAASFAAGAGLVFSGDKNYEVISDNDDIMKREYEIKKSYTAGWALFGTGIGLMAAGAVMAGIGGYYYAQLDDDASLSVQLLPNSASLTMKF